LLVVVIHRSNVCLSYGSLGGRRGGKDSIAALIATTASIRDYSEYLRPGERATVICMAVDRAQAAIVKRYVSGLFSKVPLLQSLVAKETRDGLLIGDSTEIEIITADHRSLRGRAVVCCILDECAFYPTDGSSSSDMQIYEAVKPAMATLPNSMLVAISTPYSRRGLLFTNIGSISGKIATMPYSSRRTARP
jgi:phage terminase large subunit-like protein